MPVLNKIPHKKAKLPENLRPDERVFCIPSTKEVFRDYRTFFDRAVLYNTAAWSCSVSGKNGFTFKEALDYENHARQDVEAFQQSLKVPVLYLITLIKRRSCSDLVDELVAFIKDRFFVNEDVIYTGDNGEKLPAVIKKVHCEQERPVPPPKVKTEAGGDEDDEDDECLATIAAQNKNPPPSAYKYDITVTNSGGNIWDMDVVSASQLSRKKNALSKDKVKLFVKAQCRVGSDGFWKVKTHLMALGLEDPDAITSFFSLPVPKFRPPVESRRKSSSRPTSSPDGRSRKKSKSKSSSSKPKRSETSDDKKRKKVLPVPMPKVEVKPIEIKPLTKEELAAQRRFELEQKKIIKEKEHLRVIEEKRLERERQKEERLREKQRQMEEKKRQLEYLREYNKPRDDMQCDDLRPLPRAVSIQLQYIDTKLFPELVYIIEFSHIFREFLELDLSQLTLRNLQLTVRPCSSDQSLDGLFFDLVTTFLRTIFDLRKAENEEDGDHDTSLTDTNEQANFDPDHLPEAFDFSIRNVQKASKVCAQQMQPRYGLEIDLLPVTTATLSEILRIHIWSSAALRRYNSSDEPAIDFCHLNPQIVRELGSLPVFDLDPSAKLKILRLLMDQLLAFVDFRDYIEESLDKVKETKVHLAEVQADHAKLLKARDFSAVREKAKLKPIEPTAPTSEPDAAKPPETEEEKKKNREIKTNAQKIQKCVTAFQQQEMEPFVEQTRRSSRRQAQSGSTVKSASEQLLEDSENYTLECNTAVLAHLSEEDCVTFDRWRQQVVNRRLAAIEQELQDISNVILLHQRIYNLRPLGQDRCYRRYWSFSMVPGLFVEEAQDDIPPELLIPAPQLPPKGDLPPGDLVPPPLLATWGFYSAQQDIDQLVDVLNPRGFRESTLKDSLQRQLGNLCSDLDKCPVDVLISPGLEAMDTTYSVNSALELQLRDQLLELEEKIFLGSLGVLQVPDRQAWRDALVADTFQAGVKEVKFGLSGIEEILPEPIPEPSQDGATSPKPPPISVHKLAIALLQIEQGIDRKFVKAPLWPNVNEQGGKGKSKSRKTANIDDQEDETSKSSDHTPQKPLIATWEESLMGCTSLSQVFLHVSTLDSSVLWSRSILKAHCRICRRRGDPGSMLLCDGCNLGYHCYCLRPPLKKIPEGDWYCNICKPENFVSARVANRRQGRQPRKQRDDENEQEEVVSVKPTRTSARRGRVVDEPEQQEEEAEPSEDGTEEQESEKESSEQSEHEGAEESEQDSDAVSESGGGSDEEENETATTSRTVSSRTNVDSDEDGNEDSEGEASKSGSGEEESNEGSGSEGGDSGSDGESGRQSEGDEESEDQEEGSETTSEMAHRKHTGKAVAPAQKKPTTRRDDLDYSDSSASARSLTPICALCSANAADDMAYVRCDTCSTVYHLDCVVPNPLTRKPRGGWSCYACTSKPAKRQSAPVPQQTQQTQQTAKRDAFEYASSASSSNSNQAWSTSRADQSMKKAELIVSELIKQQDAWPFLKPVSKKQVPDYFDVIKHPMDFGTIRVKMNDSPYKDASALLDDIQLVFDNCFTYNQQGDQVFNMGLAVSKVFMQRVRDLQLDSVWPSFKTANNKLSKYTSNDGGKRGASSNGSHDPVPAKQSRRG